MNGLVGSMIVVGGWYVSRKTRRARDRQTSTSQRESRGRRIPCLKNHLSFPEEGPSAALKASMLPFLMALTTGINLGRRSAASRRDRKASVGKRPRIRFVEKR